MDHARTLFLGELFAGGRDYDAQQADGLDRKRNLEEESAKLLHLLIRAYNPGKVLELGTSNGYSTVWIADALQGRGARFVTVENDVCRAGEAADNLAASGLKKEVDQRIGDAAEVLEATASDSADFIFLDAERSAYVAYWPHLKRVLTRGGLLVVDNCVSHADQVAEFCRLIDETPGFESVLVPIGAGLRVVFRDR